MDGQQSFSALLRQRRLVDIVHRLLVRADGRMDRHRGAS
jgi:hypothetical protein